MQRLRQRQAHLPGRGDGAVEPRQGHHLDDGGDAASLLAAEPAMRVLQLDLGGGVCAVAVLLLQPPPGYHVDRSDIRTRPFDDTVFHYFYISVVAALLKINL